MTVESLALQDLAAENVELTHRLLQTIAEAEALRQMALECLQMLRSAILRLETQQETIRQAMGLHDDARPQERAF